MNTTLTGIALVGSLTAASLGGAATAVAADAPASATTASVSAPYYPPQGSSGCEGRDVVITGAGHYRLVGECPSIKVEAADVRLDIADAMVGDLAAGDRATVYGSDVAGVLSIGSDSNLSLTRVGSLNAYGTSSYVRVYANVPFVTVHGDDNFVEVLGTIGSLATPGNSNRIEAGNVGKATDYGTNNSLYIKR